MVYVKMVTCENVHDFCYEKVQKVIRKSIQLRSYCLTQKN